MVFPKNLVNVLKKLITSFQGLKNLDWTHFSIGIFPSLNVSFQISHIFHHFHSQKYIFMAEKIPPKKQQTGFYIVEKKKTRRNKEYFRHKI